MTSLFRKLFSRKSQRRRTVPVESPSDTIDVQHKGSSGSGNGDDHTVEHKSNNDVYSVHHTADANSNGNQGQLPAVVGVFHDLENVSFPSKSSDATVAELVRNLTQSITDAVGCSQEVQIKAFRSYFDSSQTSSTMRRALASAGIDTIDISHLENKDKDAVDKVMLVDTMFFFADHLLHLDSSKAHKVVVLITGDRDFSVAAQRLAQRSVKVIAVLRNRQHPVHASLTAGVRHILYLDDLITAPREKKKKPVKSASAAKISKSPPRAKTIIVPSSQKTKTSSYQSDTPAPVILEAIKEHLEATPNGSILCSQLGTSLRNENGIVVSGLMSFLNSHESVFYVRGTNGNETVSLKSSASNPKLSSSSSSSSLSHRLDGMSPQQPGVRDSLSLDNVRETLLDNGGRMTITDLNLHLIRRGIRPKGLGAFLKSYPNLFQVERREEKGAEPFVTFVPISQNTVTNGEDKNDTPSVANTRTPEERIQAILDILSNAPTVWVPLNTLGISLSERGFPKMKPKISDFMRGYPNEIALRGEDIHVEAALIERMGDEQLLLDDVTDTVSSSI